MRERSHSNVKYLCEYFCDEEKVLAKHISAIHKGLQRHVGKVYEEKKQFDCTKYESSFTRKRTLNTHIKTVYEKKKPFKCNECENAFGERYTLGKPVKAVHEGIKSFTCEKCGAKVSNNLMLKKHSFKDEYRTICSV